MIRKKTKMKNVFRQINWLQFNLNQSIYPTYCLSTRFDDVGTGCLPLCKIFCPAIFEINSSVYQYNTSFRNIWSSGQYLILCFPQFFWNITKTRQGSDMKSSANFANSELKIWVCSILPSDLIIIIKFY